LSNVNDVFEDFLIAGEEIDELTGEGFFGQAAQDLLKRRELIGCNEYLYESIKIWIEGDTDKTQTKELILIFFKLFTESIRVNSQETVDVLSAFWKGTKDNPEMEGLSSYTEFARLFTETKNAILDPSIAVNIAAKRKATSSLTNCYSKGVEFIGRTLVSLIALAQIIKGEPYNFYRISKFLLFDKIVLFKDLTENKYDGLTDIVRRNVRNAEAHLGLTFSTKRNKFVLRKRVNGKLINDYISTEEMIVELFLSVGSYSQAFVFASSLLVLAFEDKDLFKKAIAEIY
jgi:hypothetical protein